MKVKLIVCDDIDYFKDNFETEINNFIKDVEVIDIKYAESYNEYGNETVGSALIMYKDKEEH